MNTAYFHNERRPQLYQRACQHLRNLWQTWLGQLTFILLAIYALNRWRIPAAIFIAVLLIGMFHRQVLLIFFELIGQINDLFLGTPVTGEGNGRVGGLVEGIRGVATPLWNWVRKPFQPRENRGIPPVTGRGRQAPFLESLAHLIDGGPEGFWRGFWHRRAEALRRCAKKAAARESEKQEELRQRELEDSTKPPLSWTHLIGGVILSALMGVFVAGDLFITLQTLFGLMGVDVPAGLAETPIFSSFEMMTGALLISTAVLFGIYIFDLLGFLPLIPLHLLSVKAQRRLLWLMGFGFIGTLTVVGALAAHRGISLQGAMDVDLVEPTTAPPT